MAYRHCGNRANRRSRGKEYKLKAGEETFTIGGNINKAYPDLTVTLSKTACTAGESFFRFCLSRVLRKTPR